jgi:hypothetical protein
MAEGRPSPKKNSGTGSGAGILIDTEHILSPDSKKSANPYYVVHKGIRYYGSSPDDVISSFKDQVGRDNIDTGANAPRKRGLWSGMLKGNPRGCSFKRGNSAKVELPKGAKMDQDHLSKNNQVGAVKSVFPDKGICERVTLTFKDGVELDYEVKYLRPYGISGRVASGLGSAGRATRRRLGAAGTAAAAGLGAAGSAARRGLGAAGSAAGRGLGVAGTRLRSGLGVAGSAAGRGLGVAGKHLRSGLGVAGTAAGRGLVVAGKHARRGLGMAASGVKAGFNRGSKYVKNKYATRQAKMNACHLRRGHGARFRKDVDVSTIFNGAAELQAKGSVGTVIDLHRKQDYSCPTVDVNFKRPGIITGIPSNLLEHVGRLGRFTQYIGRRHSKSADQSADPYEQVGPPSRGGGKTRRKVKY